MRKAATSVTNNIAEGNGRYYYQENLHFCRRSRGSVNEILDDLNICLDESYDNEEYLLSIRQDALEVRRELNQYMSFNPTMVAEAKPGSLVLSNLKPGKPSPFAMTDAIHQATFNFLKGYSNTSRPKSGC
jgi:hypothetical protein